MKDTRSNILSSSTIERAIQNVRDAEANGKLQDHPAASISASSDEVKMSWGSAMKR